MIKIGDHSSLVCQTASDLPSLPDRIQTLYLDEETTSGDPQLSSLNPWFDCSVLGFAFTFDDCPNAWYVPVRHRWGDNVPVDAAARYHRDLLKRSCEWRNHNVKYDAHVVHEDRDFAIDVLDPSHVGDLTLRDTLTEAKIVDSDRWVYSLNALANDWRLPYRKLSGLLKPYLEKSKDFGDTPADVMGEYGCGDVLTNRELGRYIDRKIHDDCRDVWRTEIALTKVLVNAERIGVRVDETELKIAHARALHRMLQLEEEIHEETGTYVRPNVNDDCYDLLCNRFGLPVLGWTKGGETGPPKPSFAKEHLRGYLAIPEAPKHLVEKLLEFRRHFTFTSLFAGPYQHLNRDGVMHAWFNQCVRTGRMSASKPNLQQLDARAKALIHAHPGYYFQTHDYSQIEFRFIVHYIRDRDAVKAYNDDPYTDFHSFVAEMCNISRKPAKTVNFMMGYGGGKKKTIKVLQANEEIAAEIEKRMNESNVPEKQRAATFRAMSRVMAETVYDDYHSTFPSLKRTSKEAEVVCRRRGYVRDHYGRHRRLPMKAAHRAFNTVNQASAADLLKERAVALYEATRGTGIDLVSLVHDEFLLMIPNELREDPRVVSDIVGILESPARPLSVPVRTSFGRGGVAGERVAASDTWKSACLDSDERDDRGDRVHGTDGELRHLTRTSSYAASRPF